MDFIMVVSEQHKATVKHGDGGIMMWAWFCTHRTRAAYSHEVDSELSEGRNPTAGTETG